jgi:hypothetical protein
MQGEMMLELRRLEYFILALVISVFDTLISTGFFLSSLGKTKKLIFWVMELRKLSLGNGHGYHQSK